MVSVSATFFISTDESLSFCDVAIATNVDITDKEIILSAAIEDLKHLFFIIESPHLEFLFNMLQ